VQSNRISFRKQGTPKDGARVWWPPVRGRRWYDLDNPPDGAWWQV